MVFERVYLEKCRLCQERMGIYEFEGDQKLMEKIYFCLNFKINEYNMSNLPKSLCNYCQNKINDIYDFIMMIQDVNEKILNVVNKTANINGNVIKISCKREQRVKTIQRQSPDACRVCKETFKCRKHHRVHFKIEHTGCCFNNSKTKLHSSSHEVPENSRTKDDKITISNNFSSNIRSDENKNTNLQEENNELASLKTGLLCSQKVSESYLCVTCGKSFVKKNSLTCHEKIHLPEKKYKCELCNISFSVRSNLRAHEKSYHEGIRFYCSRCPKEFLNKCSLDRHEKIHLGVKEFKCDHCSSCFYTRKELQKHQRYHQGLRPYKCEQCFKAFFEKHHLKIHIRSHSGERPYNCKIPGCDKSFVDSQKLKRHHRSRHNSLP